MPASSDTFEVVFRSAPVALLVLDEVGSVIAVNKAFSNLVGEDENSLLGALLFPQLFEEEQGLPVSGWEGALSWPAEDGKMVRVKALIQRLEDCRFLVQCEALADPAKHFSYEAAAKQNRLESIGLLASSVAHDLNNILTGILGHVSYFRVQQLGDANNDSLKAVEDGAKRAAAITQQILDFARGNNGTPRPVNLSQVAKAAVNLVRGSLSKNVNLSFQIAKDEPTVVGDENQLSQLIMNLIVNSRDALGGAGDISVSVEKAILSSKESNVFGLTAGWYALVRVCDNGHGIPSKLKTKIFEPFFTTKRGTGTGLGLAIVASIANAHGGSVNCESTEGHGTTFSVYLPLSEQDKKVEVLDDDEDFVPGGNETILVVDDEEAVRTIIQRSLEHLGYSVIVAENGDAALQSFGREKGKFKLVIIDMIMPQMSGDELFSKLREIDAEVPVLVASGYSSDSRTRSILTHGGRGFIQKPFAIEELAREVRRCLDNTV